MLKIKKNKIDGLLVVEPDVYKDKRGFIKETFHVDKYKSIGIEDDFVQCNKTRSVKNVLRGLHYQGNNPQGKLVTCSRGRIYDVAVDIRKDSKTYGSYFGIELTESNHKQLWIPSGFAHGFCVLSEFADVEYLFTSIYNQSSQFGIRWDDPIIAIEWPIREPILSEKDMSLPLLSFL